jgi:hypothetical protein
MIAGGYPDDTPARRRTLPQGDLPIVLWKIGLVDLATLASLIDL